MALLEASIDFQTPLTTPTLDHFQPGGGVSAAVLFAPYPFLLPTFRLDAAWFGDGPAPADVRWVDQGVGSLYVLAAGARLRPEGFAQSLREPESTGAWVEIDVGAALTGTLLRPAFEIAVGWSFPIATCDATGQVDLGPFARFTHVLQTDDSGLDGNSAYVLSVGVAATLFDAAPNVDEIAAQRAAEERLALQERDSDADGIDDADDACPYIAEDRDGYQDEDGCPDTDDDGDGIPDTTDLCPREAEDRDGWEDGDGCPDPDNDGDGFVDGADQCPDQPETVNGVDDGDGCPDHGLIELADDRIVLEERVLFELNHARVRHSARPILEAVVNLVRQHPEWRQLRIEGHADEQGEESWNVELSQRRAAQVMRVLVELGIDSEVLESEGYGSSRPRLEGDSEEAYRANRRVEIVVVRRIGEAP